MMIVQNGAQTIGRALQSLGAFDEVIVYDNGSTDGSAQIAQGFANVRLISGDFEGFGPTKNKAAGLAKHDWILIIDADEALEPQLAQTLLSTPLDPQTIYVLNFKAFYKNYRVKHCGWNDQKIRRLYHRGRTQFTDAHVHENLIDRDMNLRELGPGSMEHHSYQTLSDFIIKVDRYSSLFAQSNCGRKNSSPLHATLNAGYSFFRTYVLKLGFLDGYVGLVIAFSHMATNFYKYMKLYEANQTLSDARRGRPD